MEQGLRHKSRGWIISLSGRVIYELNYVNFLACCQLRFQIQSTAAFQITEEAHTTFPQTSSWI